MSIFVVPTILSVELMPAGVTLTPTKLLIQNANIYLDQPIGKRLKQTVIDSCPFQQAIQSNDSRDNHPAQTLVFHLFVCLNIWIQNAVYAELQNN
jgi:hypothetical protein